MHASDSLFLTVYSSRRCMLGASLHQWAHHHWQVIDISTYRPGLTGSCAYPARRCRVTPEAYAHMTAALGVVAPLAVLLEGGYNLSATAAGCEASLRVLLGQRVPPFPKPPVPSTAALLALQQVVRVQVGGVPSPPPCPGGRPRLCMHALRSWNCSRQCRCR